MQSIADHEVLMPTTTLLQEGPLTEDAWKTIDNPMVLDGVTHSADISKAFNAASSPQSLHSKSFFSSGPEPTTWSPNIPHYPYPASPDGTKFIHDREVLLPTANPLSQEGPLASSRKMMNQGHFNNEMTIALPNPETGSSASVQYSAPWPIHHDKEFNDILKNPKEPSKLYMSSNTGLQTIFLSHAHEHFKTRSRVKGAITTNAEKAITPHKPFNK
ncbi:hypothetical protein PtB15_14B403 [Puccinia triticina]|nr:hypothetical protein PtB15_14B403 [Puccinia triticina]